MLPPQLAPVPVRLGLEFGRGDVDGHLATFLINEIGLMPLALPQAQALPVEAIPLKP
jgi:hypothetical protein